MQKNRLFICKRGLDWNGDFPCGVFSKCLMRLVDVDICLPIEDLVEPQPQEGPFPTLYLLHGYTAAARTGCTAAVLPSFPASTALPW